MVISRYVPTYGVNKKRRWYGGNYITTAGATSAPRYTHTKVCAAHRSVQNVFVRLQNQPELIQFPCYNITLQKKRTKSFPRGYVRGGVPGDPFAGTSTRMKTETACPSYRSTFRRETYGCRVSANFVRFDSRAPSTLSSVHRLLTSTSTAPS